MQTWSVDDAKYHGIITRGLSNNSFLTSDPETCRPWLLAVGYHGVPRHGPREHARLMSGDWTAVIYSSGLVCTLPGVKS
jgi:hypothetical protein